MRRKPILFASNETSFTSNGIGVLSDALKCHVHEELNAEYDLELVYPAEAPLSASIVERNIIYADAGDDAGYQPFRIFRIMKLINGLITAYANHIAWDLEGVPVSAFKADNISSAVSGVKTNSAINNTFNFKANFSKAGDFDSLIPRSALSCLLSPKNSILSSYGGEFQFDGENITVHEKRGSEKNFTVKYGVNMTDLNQEKNISNVYTGLYPYYADQYGVFQLPEKIIDFEGNYGFRRILTKDLSNEFEIAPLYFDELREVANNYIAENEFGIPKVNLTIQFQSLRNSIEYKDYEFLETLGMGDTIGISFERLGVSTKARIIETTYDSLNHEYVSVVLGDAKKKFSGTISTIKKESEEANKSAQESKRAVAKVDKTVGEHSSSINALTTWQGEASKSIANVTQTATDNAASIALVVATDSEGNKTVQGAVLVEAINGTSGVTISADKINLVGYVTVSDLNSKGYQTADEVTTITKDTIKTATILASQISADNLSAISADLGTVSAGVIKSKNYDTETQKGMIINLDLGILSAKGFKINTSGAINATAGKIGALSINKSGMSQSEKHQDAFWTTEKSTALEANKIGVKEQRYASDTPESPLESREVNFSNGRVVFDRKGRDVTFNDPLMTFIFNGQSHSIYADQTTKTLKFS